MTLGEGLQLIAGILIVVFAAYYATYFIANKKSRQIPGKGINVRERFSLSKDKMVCVVEARGKAYLVVITNGGATLLDTFDAEEFETAAATERTMEPQASKGYEPNGIIARGLWKLFNSLRNVLLAKTVSTQRDTRSDSDVFEHEQEIRHVRADTIRVAREEDRLDEIQRRLKNRTATGVSPDSGEAPDDV